MRRLRKLPFAPSVGMHETPGQSLGSHLGFSPFDEDGKEEEIDELDEQLRGIFAMHRAELLL